jgi:hypothetical protein
MTGATAILELPMNRRSYLILSFAMRLLSSLGGLLNCVLLVPAGIWSGSHIVLWGICFVMAMVGAISLIWSMFTLSSQRRPFIWMALYGACTVLILGASTIASQMIAQRSHAMGGSNVSFSFAAIYFLLTITAPLFVGAMCFVDFRRRKFFRYDSWSAK